MNDGSTFLSALLYLLGSTSGAPAQNEASCDGAPAPTETCFDVYVNGERMQLCADIDAPAATAEPRWSAPREPDPPPAPTPAPVFEPPPAPAPVFQPPPAPAPAPTPQPSTGASGFGTGPGCDDPRAIEVMQRANSARADAGLPPLACDPTLTRSAFGHSMDMCAEGFFNHSSLDGRSPHDRMRDAGVRGRFTGENIGRGQRTPADIHLGWMDSPGHRRNILDRDFDRVGVAVVHCGGRPVWTQNFAG